MTDFEPHILVIDANRWRRNQLCSVLRAEGFVATPTADVSHAQSVMRSLRYDLALVDVETTRDRFGNVQPLHMSGALRDVANSITRVTKVVAMIERPGIAGIIDGEQLGATAMLRCPYRRTELMDVVKRAALFSCDPDRKSLPGCIKFGAFSYDRGSKILTKNGNPIRLLPAEAKTLEILAGRPNQYVTREVLARVTVTLSSRAVDQYILRLRRKIEENSKEPTLIRSLHGKGYMLAAREVQIIPSHAKSPSNEREIPREAFNL